MATMITNECINCGACEPECPNNAISQGDPVFVIDPQLCTECVGFHDYEACAAVCPVDCCVTDPNNIESEEVLIARARTLHQDTDFGDNFQSRFRKETAAPQAGGEVQSQSPRAPETTAPAEPKVIPAATVETAVKVEATASAPNVAPQPATVKPTPQPKKVVRPKKTFERELPESFEKVSEQFKTDSSLNGWAWRTAVVLLQPILGAMTHQTKKRLETAVQSPLFTAAGSTGLNIIHNAVIYPLALMVIAMVREGPAVIFSHAINMYLFLGIIFAAGEGIYRLKGGIFRVSSPEDMTFPASIYGVPLSWLVEPIISKSSGVIREVPIPVDGFYSNGFVEKLERERRYGNVYTLEDRGGAFLLRMEFPRLMPDIELAGVPRLPEEMPDYDYELALNNGQFIVKGKCIDEQVRKISSSIGAFPPEFTTVIPLRERVVGFAHQFEDKLLQVLLLKDKSYYSGGRRSLG